MKKYKECKAQNKAFGFNGCGKMVVAQMRKFGLCTHCYGKWLYSTDKGKEVLSKAILKVQRPRIELEKAKEESKSNKSLSYLLINVRNICHEYIRLRDKGKNCISCDEPWHNEFHACHFYKSELYSSLRFDENNIFGGCPKCNLFMDGNESGFRVGLINRYSKGFVDLIDSKALLDKKLNHKWDRFALEEIREYYKQKLKELKDAKQQEKHFR